MPNNSVYAILSLRSQYSSMHLDFVGSDGSSESAGTSSGDLTHLGSGTGHSTDGAGLTHVLLVTTTVRVINRVHGNTSHLQRRELLI
jgi:hypothetical protein